MPRLDLWNAEPGDCGLTVSLGAPWHPRYKAHYFALLRATADHLKTRASWYNALASVKPSGANLFTAENRLPGGCFDPLCCTDQVWADADYTPDYLAGFYAEQLDVIAEAFPGKTMSYALIQAGFPRINRAGEYLDATGAMTGALAAREGPFAQTETIIADGVARYPTLYLHVHERHEVRQPRRAADRHHHRAIESPRPGRALRDPLLAGDRVRGA